MDSFLIKKAWVFWIICLCLFMSFPVYAEEYTEYTKEHCKVGHATCGYAKERFRNLIHSELGKFMTQGRAYLNFRYFFEHEDTDKLSKDANASTLRSRLGFYSGEVFNFKAKIEIEDVSSIGNDLYHSPTNAKKQYPKVTAPDGTELNELWLSYDGIPDTVIRGGREALKLGNERFVGDVGGNQNNQTFDGVHIANESLEDIKLFYGYIGHVNRTYGEKSDRGDFSTDSHLFNIGYKGFDNAEITAYSYLLDVDTEPRYSTVSYGIRLDGRHKLYDERSKHSPSLSYDLEFAYQNDYEDNPKDFDALYWRTGAGFHFYGVNLTGGFESLGSDNGKVAFSTPFGSYTKWNGGKFSDIPDVGLNDAYGGISYDIPGVEDYVKKLTVGGHYHYFSAEEDNRELGYKWDFYVQTKVCPILKLKTYYYYYKNKMANDSMRKFALSAEFNISQ